MTEKDYKLVPFCGGFIKKKINQDTTQPPKNTQVRLVSNIRKHTISAGSNEINFEDLEIWKEPKIVTKYDSEYTKIHLIHWYFKSRNKLELSNIEKFHFSMLYMSDFDCKFDEIYFSVALDDINNENEKQFVKSQIVELTKYGTAKVDVNFIQNDANKGELDTWLRIFDFTYNRKDKCLLFYSHFKGVRHETDASEIANINYWSYLMYQGCLIDGFDEGQVRLQTEPSYGAFLKLNKNFGHLGLKEIKAKNNVFSNIHGNDYYYSGTYYWINLYKIKEIFLCQNIKQLDFKEIYNKQYNNKYTKTHSCEFFITSFLILSPANNQWSVTTQLHDSNNMLYYKMLSNGYFKEYVQKFKNCVYNHLIQNRQDKIVVAMTSWTKRINNVSKMIDKIKEQTLQPDHVYLTLSIEEFPHKEKDLPKDLLSKVDNFFTINWVKENTKNMKKIFPILEYLDNDDIIMNLDDDMLNIPNDLFESRIIDFYSSNKKSPITPNSSVFKFDNISNYWFSGCCSCFSKKMLRNYKLFINRDVMNCYEDDRVCTYIIHMNNYKFKVSSSYTFNSFSKLYCIDDNFGNNTIRIYNAQKTMDVCKKRCQELKSIWENKLTYFGYDGDINAGDIFGKFLLDSLYDTDILLDKKNSNISIIGSILESASKQSNIICGCGFMYPNTTGNNYSTYRSVRGELSKQRLNKQGVSNEILVGDPGLLASFILPKDKLIIGKRYTLGIIPHYVDKDYIRKIYNNSNILVIDIQTNNFKKLFSEINSCDYIISSSLHGIIFAHSYGIPASHFTYNDLADKTEFKFDDYYSVFGIEHKRLLFKGNTYKLNELIDFVKNTNQPTTDSIINIQNNIIKALPYKELFFDKYKNNIDVAICAIAKNEDLYINDWVKYHIDLGVSYIYLYDNNDTKNIGDNIDKKYLQYVTIIDVHNKKQYQQTAYNDCYKKYNTLHDWIAFIDIDEFITTQDNKSIIDVFSSNKYYRYDVIRLTWNTYNDNGLLHYENKPVYERFTNIINKLHQSKSIVRCNLKSVNFISVHYPIINDKLPNQCTPEYFKSEGEIESTHCFNVMHIRHYMTKTVEEFITQKIGRGDAARIRTIDMKYFWDINIKTPEKESIVSTMIKHLS